MVQIFQVSKASATVTRLSVDDAKRYLIEIRDHLKEKLIENDFNPDFFVFPSSIDEAVELKSNGIHWAYMRTGYAELGPPDLCFVTPLSSNTLLMIEGDTGDYNFELPDGHSDAMLLEAENDLFDFIKSIRIDFSPEIQAQIDKARTTESA
jgi:hypothetical protein|tara:strand:+ start:36681 stop:37133 length:453 start_codon:yes stop_codon:yes gene_type:complete